MFGRSHFLEGGMYGAIAPFGELDRRRGRGEALAYSSACCSKKLNVIAFIRRLWMNKSGVLSITRAIDPTCFADFPSSLL